MFLALTLSLAVSGAMAGSVADLAWLAGTWRSQQEGVIMEES